jgi:hypothetical protein
MNAAGILTVAAAAALTAGCATRGSINIACDGFARHVEPLEPSQLVQDIQSDTNEELMLSPPDDNPAAPPAPLRSKLARSMEALALGNDVRRAPVMFLPPGPKPRAVLLLSGGGQWGAFGAGYLGELLRLAKERAGSGQEGPIDYGVITGVSTGGLQSLFVAIDKVDASAYDDLRRNYSPARESDVVNRNAKPLAVLTGSLAGLKPLKRKIEQALCEKGDPARGCPMIEKLAASGRQVFIGFVEAANGQFQYADATGFASAGAGAGAGEEQRRNAQQCLTGIALASAAMPVFFQQVRINGKTYYDGGVRQSVFEQNVAESLEKGVAQARLKIAREEAKSAAGARRPARPADISSPDLYVVRNGPTELLGKDGKPDSDTEADRKADALTAAFRAEAIVVNQLEVGSIAALRLAHPTGDIRLITADGYHRWLTPPGSEKPVGCEKPPGVMFDPTFMECLQRFGEHKARPERAR